MRVRNRTNGARGSSSKFNTHSMGEIIVGFDDDGGMDSDFISDYDVQLHTGEWVPLRDAFLYNLVICDNYNTYFKEPKNLLEMERGWSDY